MKLILEHRHQPRGQGHLQCNRAFDWPPVSYGLFSGGWEVLPVSIIWDGQGLWLVLTTSGTCAHFQRQTRAPLSRSNSKKAYTYTRQPSSCWVPAFWTVWYSDAARPGSALSQEVASTSTCNIPTWTDATPRGTKSVGLVTAKTWWRSCRLQLIER